MATYTLTGSPISSSAKSVRIRIPRFKVPSLTDTLVNSVSVTLPFRLDSGYSTGNYSVTLILCTGISNNNWYEYDSGGYSYYGTDTGNSSDRIYTEYYSHVIPSSKILATTTGTINFSATQTNTPTTFTFSGLNLSTSSIGSTLGVAVLYSNNGALEYYGEQSCTGTITTSTNYTITYWTSTKDEYNDWPADVTVQAGETFTIPSAVPYRHFDYSYNYITLNYNYSGSTDGTGTITHYKRDSIDNWVDLDTGTQYERGSTYTPTKSITLQPYSGWWNESWTKGFTLPTPTRTGYTFQGWYSASSGGTKVGNGGDTYSSTEYSTIYAQWAYTVTYSNNGGWIVPSAQTANVGTNIVLSETIPTKANDNYVDYTTTLVYNNGNSNETKSTQSYTQYIFNHWYNGDSTWNPGDTYTGQISITLYINYRYGTRWTGFQLPAPTRTGYTFDYWGDSSGNKLETSTGADGAAGSWYYPRSTQSIYAYWKADKNITAIKYFPSSTSTSPITTKVHYYDGSNWIPITTVYYYNGSSWVEVGDKIPYIE